MTRTCVAQVVSLACAHHIPCVISMRSCCVFDSLRLLHFPLFAVYLLSYRPVFPPGHQLHLPRCGGQIPYVLRLTRALALLPSTTSHRKRSRIFKDRSSGWRKVSKDASQDALAVPKVCIKEEEKEKERLFSDRAFPEDVVKCLKTFACLSEGGENDNEFSSPGVFSSRVPVLKTPFFWA